MEKKAICFLTLRPSTLFYHFCKQLQNNEYDVFVCIDDNNYVVPMEYHISSIHIIQIKNSICETAGFKSTVQWFNNRACSRDKSLYYFCKIITKYTHVWFIEEDVFIPHMNTIKNIDYKHKDADLLCASNEIVSARDAGHWFWPHIFKQTSLDPPFGRSMICAVRVSCDLLKVIEKYATTYNNLFMDESLFNTLALHNNLTIQTPEELSTIHWRNKWNLEDILITNMYHPMKNIDQHYHYRRKLRIHV